MPVNYTYKIEQDNHIITALEEIDVELKYGETSLSNRTLEIDTTYTLPITIDGEYTVSVSNSSEQETFTIYSMKSLQVSLIKDILTLLCSNCGCGGCKDDDKCLTKEAKKLLKVQNIFNKVNVFHLFYIPKYNETQLIKVTNYLSEAFSSYKCDIQNLINNIIKEECIKGVSKFDLKLFKLHLFIFWSAMYFTENELTYADIEYNKRKFFYNDILKCMCDICLDIDALEELFNTSASSLLEIYSFQFDSYTNNIDNVDLLTEEYLSTIALQHTEESMLEGKNIANNTVGRYGFAIRTTNENLYRIQDVNNFDITEIAFEKSVDASRGLVFYVSKELASISEIYAKFIKQ